MEVGVLLQTELGGGADDALLIAPFADPDRHRRAPEPAARELPIDVVLEPVAHAPSLDVLGDPVRRVVVGDELVLALRCSDVPRVERVIDQRRAAAPAEGVGVEDGVGLVEQAARLEVVHDHRVGLLDVKTGELLDIWQELAVQADRVLEGNALLLAQAQVVDSIERARVDDARALVDGDEVRVDHVLRLALLGHRVRVQRLVLEADQVAAEHPLFDLRGLLQDGEPRLGQDEVLVALLDLDVDDVGRHGERDVPRESPRRGRPREDRGCRILLQPELDVHARVRHVVAVALRQLVARQRRGAPGAVRRHAETLVDEVLLPHLAERPPHRLDVLGRQRPVSVLVVLPERHALAECDPVVDVLVHALPAQLVEALDTDLVLDLELAGDVELLLDLDLDGQAMRVPARLAFHVEAAHGLVAAEQVLERAGEDVVRRGLAVGGRRPFIEDEALLALAQPQGFLEGVFRLPALHELLLELGEADLLIDFLEQLLVLHRETEFGSLGRAGAARGTTQIPEATTSDSLWVTARE